MEKVKDLKKVILPERTVLGEVMKPKRFIITPSDEIEKDSYVKIIAKSKDIPDDDLAVGDIVIKYGGSLYGYAINAGRENERTLCVMHRGNINVAVRPDNFIDPDILTSKVNI